MQSISPLISCPYYSFMDLPGTFMADAAAKRDPTTSWQKCTDNGEVVLPFGAAEYVGLGFSVFMVLLISEVFGSPFVRNCQVAIALLVGFAISALARYPMPGNTPDLKYVTNDKINSAPGITFLWVKTFPLSVYVPAIIPVLIGFIITTVESVGDITASAEASRVDQDGEIDSRIQGGLLTDGIASVLSGLLTVLPNTTFSQNNGVISLTRCANKRAGYCCCAFLISFGIIAKIAAIINTIPYCILGGMTTFLFVNIVVSGIKILGPDLAVRRSRFIVASSLAIGIGVALVPAWASNDLIRPGKGTTNKLLSDVAVIVLTTPYCIGTLIAMVLHAILPFDEEDSAPEQEMLVKEALEPIMSPVLAPQPMGFVTMKDPTMQYTQQQSGGYPQMPGAHPQIREPMGNLTMRGFA